MASQYKGELAKKLPKRDSMLYAALLAHEPQEFSRLIDEEVDAKHRKLELLLKHYNIKIENEPEGVMLAYYRLALRLAEDHVPGFRIGVTRGRPKQWTDTLRRKAAVALGRLSAQYPGEPYTKLATRLVRQAPWCELSKTSGALLKQVRLLNVGGAADLVPLRSLLGRPANKLEALLWPRKEIG